MHAGENDQIRRCLLSLLRESQAIPNIIRHVLDIRLLVIVREDNRILLSFQFFDLQEKVKLRRNGNIQKSPGR